MCVYNYLIVRAFLERVYIYEKKSHVLVSQKDSSGRLSHNFPENFSPHNGGSRTRNRHQVYTFFLIEKIIVHRSNVRRFGGVFWQMLQLPKFYFNERNTRRKGSREAVDA